MNITSTSFQTQPGFGTRPQNTEGGAPIQPDPSESMNFSDGSVSGKEMFQIGTIAVAGGLIGAVPVLGAVSNGIAVGANQDDDLGGAIGAAGLVTNLVASLMTAKGNVGAWPLAVPAVLGAITWGGYAANRAAEQ